MLYSLSRLLRICLTIWLVALSLAGPGRLVAGAQPVAAPTPASGVGMQQGMLEVGPPRVALPAAEIAFVHDGAIWLASLPGGQARQLTASGEIVPDADGYFPANSAPVWSPDGQALLHRRDGQVWLLTVATGEDRPLPSQYPEIYSVEWSPDGRWIIYPSGRPDTGGGCVVQLWNPATGEQREFCAHGGMVTPDGRYISYWGGIWNQVDLSTLQETELTTAEPTTDPDSFTVTPDGTLYYIQRPYGEAGSTAIQLMKLAPDGTSTLVRDLGDDGLSPNMCQAEVYSRATPWLAIPYTCASRARGLLVVDPDSGQSYPIVGPQECGYFERWAPVGPRLAFRDSTYCADYPDYELSTATIHVADVGPGAPQVRAVSPALPAFTLDWAPDGQWLTFAAVEARVEGPLWVSNANTGAAQQLGVSGWFPRWRPGLAPAPPAPTPVPAPTSTATPLPLPTDTPVPPATPTPAVDPAQVRSWLEEKSRLVNSLETLNIPTNLFVVPGIRAYDEQAARALLARVQQALADGTLTPQQADAFARLTYAERGLGRMLPIYTTVAATLADTGAQTIETGVGVVFSLRPAWKKCAGIILFCENLQKASEDAIWRLIRDGGKAMSHAPPFAKNAEEQRTTATAWDLLIRLAQDKLAEGASLRELVLDEGVQAGGTAVLIQPYLRRTQRQIDQAVRTADPTGGGERWPITGSLERAALAIDYLPQQAEIQQEEALSRHTDFSRGTDILKLAEDLADLAALSPGAVIAKAVGLGARVEHVVLNAVELFLAHRNLECVDYLAGQVGLYAFDARRPTTSCTIRAPAAAFQPILVGYQRNPVAGRLLGRLQTDSADYQQAVQGLVQAVNTDDALAVEAAIGRVITAEASLDTTLDQYTTLVLTDDTLPTDGTQLFNASGDFAAANFDLYVTVAETLLARQDGTAPSTRLDAAATTAINSATQAVAIAAAVPVAPPAGAPVLVLAAPATQPTQDGQVQLAVTVSNVGAAPATDGRFQVLLGDQLLAGPISLEVLAPDSDQRVTLLIAPPAGSLVVTVQAWTGDRLQASRLVGLPVASAPAAVDSSAESAPGAAPTSGATREGAAGGLPASLDSLLLVTGAGLVVLIGLILVGVLWRRAGRGRRLG